MFVFRRVQAALKDPGATLGHFNRFSTTKLCHLLGIAAFGSGQSKKTKVESESEIQSTVLVAKKERKGNTLPAAERNLSISKVLT